MVQTGPVERLPPIHSLPNITVIDASEFMCDVAAMDGKLQVNTSRKSTSSIPLLRSPDSKDYKWRANLLHRERSELTTRSDSGTVSILKTDTGTIMTQRSGQKTDASTMKTQRSGKTDTGTMMTQTSGKTDTSSLAAQRSEKSKVSNSSAKDLVTKSSKEGSDERKAKLARQETMALKKQASAERARPPGVTVQQSLSEEHPQHTTTDSTASFPSQKHISPMPSAWKSKKEEVTTYIFPDKTLKVDKEEMLKRYMVDLGDLDEHARARLNMYILDRPDHLHATLTDTSTIHNREFPNGPRVIFNFHPFQTFTAGPPQNLKKIGRSTNSTEIIQGSASGRSRAKYGRREVSSPKKGLVLKQKEQGSNVKEKNPSGTLTTGPGEASPDVRTNRAGFSVLQGLQDQEQAAANGVYE